MSNGKKMKPLQELTFKDNFMFGVVMSDPEICAGVVERCLGIPIERVEVVFSEHTLHYHSEHKGIRLDAYAKDKNNTRYNIEMQTYPEKDILKRGRYYASQIDMELLLMGEGYDEIPNTYIIFICDYDPFGKGFYKYESVNLCKEDPSLSLDDGSHKIFLSTVGKNPEEISPELLTFLTFAGYNLEESNKLSEDEFIRKIQATIQSVKVDRERGAEYMRYTVEMQKQFTDGRNQGLAEGRAAGLEEGRAAGLEEGRAAGLEVGRNQERINAIKNMLEIGATKTQILKNYSEEEYNIAVSQ